MKQKSFPIDDKKKAQFMKKPFGEENEAQMQVVA